MNKATLVTALFLSFMASFAAAQWEDGILMDVQEVNIAQMKASQMSGAEAVMLVI